jgi:hypothetical protein
MPDNKGFKYVYIMGHISDVLQKIQDTGRPDKLNFPYIRDTWLLKNAQYSAVLDLLTDMGFLDNAGIPTSIYAAYQNPTLAKITLAKGIRNAYPTLFRAYPNAQNLTREELTGYIKQQTGADQSVLEKTVGTFMKLCSLADFSAKGLPNPEAGSKSEEELILTKDTLIPITMNIQIVIPNDATDEQYDRIFSSIKKFLTR